MNSLNEAERYLLDQIRHGDEDVWFEFIQRYQGRLRSFATGQLQQPSDADDVVQETFVSFLKSMHRFDGQTSLESFLFGILRRRIVDVFRKRGAKSYVHVCQITDEHSDGTATNLIDQTESRDPSSSWYVENSENTTNLRSALWNAMSIIIDDLKTQQRIQDLQIFELLFYAYVRNQEIAKLFEIDEKKVALAKHRLIKRIAAQLSELTAEFSDVDLAGHESMISELWVEHRPTCPKRSTLGKYLLSTIEDDWKEYIHLHLDKIGCNFCNANLEDMRQESESHRSNSLNDRIMQSSIGFLPSDG